MGSLENETTSVKISQQKGFEQLGKSKVGCQERVSNHPFDRSLGDFLERTRE
jgi:hypothetical protein